MRPQATHKFLLPQVPDHYSCLVGIAHMSTKKNRSSDQAGARMQKALSVCSYEPLFRAKREHLTVELTRRRESKHPPPDHSSCETRSRRSRPTICCAPTPKQRELVLRTRTPSAS